MSNKDFFIINWKKEMKRTIKAIEALKEDMRVLDYSPDPKSRTALQIIAHILPHSQSLHDAIESGDIWEEDKNFISTKEAYEYHEYWSNKLIEKLQTVSDETWENKKVTLSTAERKNIYEGIMRDMYWVLMFDVIHHRGQLSTYYRSMGLRNPSLYGPTAEDREDIILAAKTKIES